MRVNTSKFSFLNIGKWTNHKGKIRSFTNPEDLEKERRKEEREKRARERRREQVSCNRI